MNTITEAAKRACGLSNEGADPNSVVYPNIFCDGEKDTYNAFANYIQQVSDTIADVLADTESNISRHGKVGLQTLVLPDDVDPLLIEAREIAKDIWTQAGDQGRASTVISGDIDGAPTVRAAYEGLKRRAAK